MRANSLQTGSSLLGKVKPEAEHLFSTNNLFYFFYYVFNVSNVARKKKAAPSPHLRTDGQLYSVKRSKSAVVFPLPIFTTVPEMILDVKIGIMR